MDTYRKNLFGLVAIATIALIGACGDDRPLDGAVPDGGGDGAPMDAAPMDGGTDAGADSSLPMDGGMDAPMDGSMDGSPADATMDALPDAADGGLDAMVDAGPTDFDAAILTAGPACPCSFCWSYPLPEGEDLNAAWGMDGRIWVGGDLGILSYWDGTEIRRAPRAAADVQAVSGVTLRDAHALTVDDEVLHWDGMSWTALAAAPITGLVDIHARASDDVWVVSDRVTARYDGTGWTTSSPMRVNDFGKVWATGAGEAFAVGEYTIEHLAAGTWTREASSVSGFRFRDVWGTAPDDVWVAGGSMMRLYHYDGTDWSIETTTGSGGQPELIGGTGPNDIWAVASITGDVVHYDGTGWSGYTLPDGLEVSAIAVPTPGEPWLFGAEGHVARFVSGAFERVGAPATWASPEQLWASGASDVWVTGFETGPLHYDGTGWSIRPVGGSPQLFRAVFGFGPDDVWVSSLGGHRWNGTSWTSHTLLINFADIWGAASDDVWFVGGGGRAGHWDGTSLTEVLPSPSSSSLNGIYGFAADDIWAVGVDGVFRYDGSWASFTTPTSEILDSVWGSGPSDVWIGGRNGALYQWNGTIWMDRSLSTSAAVRSITGTGASDVWFVLDARPANVYHWNGTTLSSEVCTDQSARGVAVAGSDVWLGVSSGMLQRMP